MYPTAITLAIVTAFTSFVMGAIGFFDGGLRLIIATTITNPFETDPRIGFYIGELVIGSGLFIVAVLACLAAGLCYKHYLMSRAERCSA